MKIDFFCESCGAQVQGNATSCPDCKKFFKGIRCPQCLRMGNIKIFLNGCPQCGYLAEIIPLEMVNGDSFWNRWPKKPDWPASRYWILSAFLVLVVTVTLFFWV